MYFTLEEVKKKDECWPEPRSGHRMCADENYLYVFGGYDPIKDNRLYNELWRYNISTEKWVKLPDAHARAPVQCASSTMLLFRKKLIIFGGSGYPFAEQNSNKLYVYCLKTYQWIDLNAMGNEKSPYSDVNFLKPLKIECDCSVIPCKEPPIPKYGHSMALSRTTGDIFIFSGTTGRSFTDELHKFSLDELTWHLMEFCPKHREERPCGRYRHEVVWNDKEFFIFGGSTLHDTFGIETVHSFDFKSHLWSKHSCSTTKVNKRDDGSEAFIYPLARKAHTCVLFNDYMYMVGGIIGNSGNNQQFQDIWAFALKTKTWYYSNKVVISSLIIYSYHGY